MQLRYVLIISRNEAKLYEFIPNTDRLNGTWPSLPIALESFPIVLVGDYDASVPPEQSVQLREVQYVSRWANLVTLALLKDPVTLEGFVPAPMSGELAPPAAGANLTFVGYHGGLLPTGQEVELNVTELPGPALEATMEAFDSDICEMTTQTSREYVLCARPRKGEADPAFPCGGTYQLRRLARSRGGLELHRLSVCLTNDNRTSHTDPIATSASRWR